MILLKYKRHYGICYDLADSVFSDVNTAVANLGNAPADTGSGGVPNTNEGTLSGEGSKQDVDPATGQGNDNQPAPSGEKGLNQPPVDKTGEPQKDTDNKSISNEAAANLRKFGEEWKSKHEAVNKRVTEELEPLLNEIDETFGGRSNLKLAGEIYQAISAEQFDASSALEYLAENVPEVAKGLVNHIAQTLVGEATASAISRTFGRELSEEDLTDIKAFLATGKSSTEYSKFLQSEGIPESMKVDANGDPLPQSHIDYMQKLHEDLKAKDQRLSNLESRFEAGEKAATSERVQGAVQAYIAEQLSPIDTKISEMGLRDAYEGETPEMAEKRTELANAVEALALAYAANDKPFQTLYKSAVGKVGKAASNRVALAQAEDSSLRIQARMGQFADKAAKVLSPLFETIQQSRNAQLEKTRNRKEEVIETSGTLLPTEKRQQSNPDDPFNIDDILSDANRLLKNRR